MKLTIMGLDPGSKNFARSVVRIPLTAPFKVEVLEVGMVDNAITNLPALTPVVLRKFTSEIRKPVRRHGVDAIAAERYMNRGRTSGATGELVSIMLGSVMSSVKVKDVSFITAAQWKNAFNRLMSLDRLYAEASVVPHIVDATCIAIYSSIQYLQYQIKPFEGLTIKSLVRKIEDAQKS